MKHVCVCVCVNSAGLNIRKAGSARAAEMKGLKGRAVMAEVAIRRSWSQLRRSLGSVSSQTRLGYLAIRLG